MKQELDNQTKPPLGSSTNVKTHKNAEDEPKSKEQTIRMKNLVDLYTPKQRKVETAPTLVMKTHKSESTRKFEQQENVDLEKWRRRNEYTAKAFDLQDKRKLYAKMAMPKRVYDKDFDTNYYDEDHELQ